MDFPQLMPSGAAMTQQGWVQPFKAGGGPILPATATWASRPPLPETTRARQEQQQKQQSAAPVPQVSGGSSQQQKRESEELKKMKEENAQLRELVSEMRKEMAELRAAISEPRREGDQTSMAGRKRRAIGETREPDGFEAFQQQISQTLAKISESIIRIGKDIDDLKKQRREQHRRVCNLEEKQGSLQRTSSQPNVPMANEKPDGQVNRKDLLYKGSYDDWREKLLSDVAAATKEIETDANIEVMDSRLAHLMEAKRSIKQRWEKNKLNRALRKRIARLNTQIAQYAGELERKQWIEVCDKVDGQMRVGGKWNLLKHFLKAGNTRSAQRSAIERLVHREFEGRHKDQLIDELAERYLPIHAGRVEAEDSVYEGEEVQEIDSDITSWEVRLDPGGGGGYTPQNERRRGNTSG
ncbi:hypothetical protein HPB50_008814 [Hyalomma asiaticum]|uniref:Uncharacterized protein n=1 Tax=Hyalomma asiaticum TaxID=266040 RepID=A0ACB7RLS9_HYAAI|nr:hypothetical protein HPB50_008814 [Hyalomma asiaticum]